MKEIVKEIILDFQSEVLETGIKRHLSYELVPRKAFVCIGVRRCGKSTLLFQIMEQLLKKGVSRQNILYLNFFDDRLQELKRGDLSIIFESYYSLFPEKKGVGPIYCFFDELQEVHGWELFIDRILRTEKCEVFISGSSAKMLSREIATQMRGRSLSWELFPFSFPEFLDFKNVKQDKGTSRNRFILEKSFVQYWETGGFPEVLNVSEKIRIRILQEYFKTIIHRDIIERFDALHPQAVMEAAYRLISSCGSLYSINRITDYLKSLGYKLSKEFVGNCIQWFEDAFFLFSTQLYDASVSRRNANPKKIYCIDHALARSVVSGIAKDDGHLLENLVFVDIRRRISEIYYYRTARGNEVDFLTIDREKNKSLIQVCYSFKNIKTRKREVHSLFQAMKELRIYKAIIVTFEEEDTIKENKYSVTVIPAYKFSFFLQSFY